MKIRLDDAFKDALLRYEQGMGSAFPYQVTLNLTSNEKFYAVVKSDEGTERYLIKISDTCINSIDTLWRSAWNGATLIDNKGNRIAKDDGTELTLEEMCHRSLTWLILHELMHIQLGHLELLNIAALVEIEMPESGLGKPSKKILEEHLSENEKQKLRPCLEMQADSEATEVMLGVYSEDNWRRFRIDAAAIFAVMALMEKAEEQSRNLQEKKNYPKAATRFFTLFGVLFQYWLYPGADLQSLEGQSYIKTDRHPNSEEFMDYYQSVLGLMINDAVQIALWAEARSFIIDIGNDGGLLKDIFKMQYATNLIEADMVTDAAIEWRDLYLVNERIMELTGLRT